MGPISCDIAIESATGRPWSAFMTSPIPPIAISLMMRTSMIAFASVVRGRKPAARKAANADTIAFNESCHTASPQSQTEANPARSSKQQVNAEE